MKSDEKQLNSDRWSRLWANFDLILTVEPEDKNQLIEKIKQEQPDLFPELLGLIESHSTESTLLDQPVVVQSLNNIPLPEEVAGFQIKKLLGSGGLADVYQGVKLQDGHERIVAIKLVNMGSGVPWVVDSFQNELQFLFDLNHVNIERLYEGGVTSDGMPYLVVEYINGCHLDKYCDQNELNLSQRVSLFNQICQAVAVMHQSLMIHRDIKPSNVMVAQDGTVKLLDFGLAKLVKSKKEQHTDLSDLMMTVAYASPEQKANEHLTTASDVYALGLLLFQLLTGTKPSQLNLKDGKNNSGNSVLASDYINTKAVVFETELNLKNKLKAELDWIITKCLHENPRERYGSAQQLLDEVIRYQCNKPVKAMPDSVTYRVKKFVHRHQLGVFSFSVFMAAILLLVSLLFQKTQALSESLQAVESEKNKVNQVTQYLVDVFKLSDPIKNKQGKTDVKTLLDYSAQQLELQFDNEPETKSMLFHTLGTVYLNMSDIESASFMLDKAGAFDVKGKTNVAIQLTRVQLLEKKGEIQAALDTLESLRLDADKQLSDSEQLKALLLKGQLLYQKNDLEAAKRLLINELAIYQNKQQHKQSGTSQTEADIDYLLGSIFWKLGDMNEVSKYYSKSYKSNLSRLGEQHHSTLKSQSAMGVLAYTMGDFEQALSHFQSVLDNRTQQLGKHHDLTADAHNRLGATWYELGKGELAETHYRAALTAFEVNGLNQSLKFARVLNNLGLIKRQQQKFDEASVLFEQALAIQEELLGAGHPSTAAMMNNLGLVAFDQSAFQQALLWFERAFKIQQGEQGELHVNTAFALTNMGHMQVHLNQPAHAAKHINKAIQLRKTHLGENHLLYAASLVVAAELAMHNNDLKGALNSFETAYEIRKNQLKSDDWRVIELRMWLFLLGSKATVHHNLACDWQLLRDQLGGAHPKVIALAGRMVQEPIKLFDCE